MKHTLLTKTVRLRPDDFYEYSAICTCGKVFSGWKDADVKKRLEEHINSKGEKK